MLSAELDSMASSEAVYFIVTIRRIMSHICIMHYFIEQKKFSELILIACTHVHTHIQRERELNIQIFKDQAKGT